MEQVIADLGQRAVGPVPESDSANAWIAAEDCDVSALGSCMAKSRFRSFWKSSGAPHPRVNQWVHQIEYQCGGRDEQDQDEDNTVDDEVVEACDGVEKQ